MQIEIDFHQTCQRKLTLNQSIMNMMKIVDKRIINFQVNLKIKRFLNLWFMTLGGGKVSTAPNMSHGSSFSDIMQAEPSNQILITGALF